jgi:uncharacterized protein YecT (DUF1311 family)
MKMKHLLAIIIIILIAIPISAENKKSCFDTAITQLDLNNCAAIELKEADDELNQVYKEITKRNGDDKVFLDRLKAAQRAWFTFRDAELEALFPEVNKQSQYGSSYPMCYANWKATVTKERTQQLKKWITGVREGDVCSGSLPVK